MANLFNSVKIKQKKRNKFNLSHSSRLTTEFGRLTPILCEPVIPADKFRVNTTLKIRFAPMTFPVMERFKAYVHYWFVPNRLIWDNWETFITGGETGLEDTLHPYPVIKCGKSTLDGYDGNLLPDNFTNGSLFDYLGFPAISQDEFFDVGFHSDADDKYFDALPFKAYQLIYNEFYRDQNLEDPIKLKTDMDGVQDGDDDQAFENSLMRLRYHAWRKDYFTSALKDPQRGPEVTLPMYGDIRINSTDPLLVNSAAIYDVDHPNDSRTFGVDSNGYMKANGSDLNDTNIAALRGTLASSELSRVRVDTTNTRMASINDVRRGFALQRLYEIAARVGGRYVENILGNFGVFAGDARLQRPEYLGGSSLPIYVGDVLQTSESTDDGTPLGMPAGVAGALGSSKAFTRTFKEHGWIIGIMFVQPDATYFQGLPRKFTKFDRLDYLWPTFANIGEQEIMNQELYFGWNDSEEINKSGFGYTPRYAEYRFGMSGIHGDFRDTLADFHDARKFEVRPALNNEFIRVKPTGNSTGLNRIFAVNSEQYDHIWVHLYNDITVFRKLPKYGTPI